MANLLHYRMKNISLVERFLQIQDNIFLLLSIPSLCVRMEWVILAMNTLYFWLRWCLKVCKKFRRERFVLVFFPVPPKQLFWDDVKAAVRRWCCVITGAGCRGCWRLWLGQTHQGGWWWLHGAPSATVCFASCLLGFQHQLAMFKFL